MDIATLVISIVAVVMCLGGTAFMGIMTYVEHKSSGDAIMELYAAFMTLLLGCLTVGVIAAVLS